MIELKHKYNPEQYAPLCLNMHEAGFLLEAVSMLRKGIKYKEPEADEVLTEMCCFMTDKLFNFNSEYYSLPSFPELSHMTPEEFTDACKSFNRKMKDLRVDELKGKGIL